MIDQDIRSLERRALDGDQSARDRLAIERTRAGFDEQSEALRVLMSGRSAFLTGAAGTGKSFVVRRFMEECRKIRRRVIVSATTGVAALALGGTTLHRATGVPVDRVRSKRRAVPENDWGDFGEGSNLMTEVAATYAASDRANWDDSAEDSRIHPSALVVQSYKQPWKDWTARRLRFGYRPDRRDDTTHGPGVLIVDEVSMASADLIDNASWLCAVARGVDAPFGGLQVVFVGDLGQLPPVDERLGWAHESAAWRAMDPVVLALTQVRRQTDRDFADLLGRVRLGELAPRDRETLMSRVNAYDPAASATRAVRILSTNRECQAVNDAELQKLPGPTRVRLATEGGASAVLADLDRGCPSPRELKLRVGARVLLTQNDMQADPPRWANGTAGTVREIGAPVLDMADGTLRPGVLVEADDGLQIPVLPARWEIREHRNGVEEVVAWREQLPIRHGWAITAHRAQGATLDRASVDLSGAFACGAAYVALSRVRTLAGLNLESSKCGRLEAHEKFLAFEAARKPWGVIA